MEKIRSHKAKNVIWIVGDLVRAGARTLGDLWPVYDPSSDHPEKLDAIKQLEFYTDCFGKRHWSEPHEVIDASLARHLVSLAKLLCPKRQTSAREIEL